jgi:cytochrome c556
MPSEAKNAVWSDWEEFASLAEDLHRLSEGLGMAADNGIGGVSGAGSASMMGTDTMMGGQTGMMGDASPGAMIGFEELAEMPADAVFTMIAQTCSACHTRYRAESK